MPLSWRDIHGFGEHDFAGFYEKMVAEAPPGSRIVEVGCFHGRSLVHLAQLARDANKGLEIVGVDWGLGMGDGSLTGPLLLENVRAADVHDCVTVILEPSVQASRLFADDSCWMVFLDDDHRAPAVEAGVRAWMPKVLEGGWLAGHDYRWNTVVEPVHALLRGIIHDPTWDNVWMAPKQEPQSGPHVNIYKPTTIPQSLDPDYR